MILQSNQSLQKSCTTSCTIIQKIHDQLNTTEKNFVFLWIPNHLGIRMNEKVDDLAKNAIIEPLFKRYLFIKNDLKDTSIKLAWNNEWENQDASNELRKIKPTVKGWSANCLLNRKDSIILTRLRIGHTRLTKSYYFNNIPPPTCFCGETLTVTHIFVSCVKYVNNL